MKPTKILTTLCALLTAAHLASAESRTWTSVAPGVWKATVGFPEDYNLLSASGAIPVMQHAALSPDFPLDKSAISASTKNNRTALSFPLALDEDIYGLGVDFKTMRRTGSTFQLHEDHYGGFPGRTHAPVPLYVSSKGYGVLINAARYINVNVGLAVRIDAPQKPPALNRNDKNSHWAANPRSNSIDFLIPAPGTEIYLFAGPTPIQVMQRYNLLCGGGAMPPKWGLGFLTRTPSLYTADQVENEVAQFQKQKIPLDILGLEPGWQSASYPGSFEWDKSRFPDPKKFLDHMNAAHIHINLWFNPYVKPDSDLYKNLLPYAGSHLVWNGMVPDYSMPEARKIFADHLAKTCVDIGISGFKIDEVDGYDQWLWPDQATFPSGHDGEQLRQTFGVQIQRTIYDLYHDRNQRTFGQVRGTNAGASRFPFVIYNDNYDFNEYITAVGNTAFAGVLWSPEVRGGEGEDMLRRTQAVCFSPLALFNGWATDTKLWSHPEVANEIRDTIQLRHRLLPYWYTTFAEYHFQGTPPIRPMPLIEGAPTTQQKVAGKLDATSNPYAIGKVVEIKDEYMAGDSLLVAPIAPGTKSRTVYLPPGKWYDFYSGKLAGEGGGDPITVTPPLSQMPLFVKDGALIPLIPEGQTMPGADDKTPLEIRHYGDANGELDLYDDDGVTFNYEKGEFSWTHFSVSKDANGKWNSTTASHDPNKPWHYSDVTFTFLPQEK